MLTPDEQRILTHIVTNPRVSHATVTLKALKSIMLATSGEQLANGRIYQVRSRRLCPGVYDIRLELSR